MNFKNNKFVFKRGFTLIELLIVVAIVGVLSGAIFLSMASSREKASISSTKQVLSSLKSAMAVCCSNGNAHLKTVAGQEICSQPLGVKLPLGRELKLPNDGDVSYVVVSDCIGNSPEMKMITSNHPSSACRDSVTGWRLKIFDGLISPSGC